jgi:uncharacterized membrane protein SirB2
MPYEIYKLLHVFGLMLLFLGLGGQLLAPRAEPAKAPKITSVLYGIGLLIMLFGGFGMMARLGIQWPWPGWLIAKLAVWITIGALPFFVRREVLARSTAWWVAAGLGALAAWLAINKPF